MKIIPAIDIMDGKCVRLTQGNYSQSKIYPVDPVEMALQFRDMGTERLHLVDLDGARASDVVNLRVLERICRNTGLEVDFGGGIKSDRAVRAVFDAGAAYACIGSLAQTDPGKVCEWLEHYGNDRFIIGADIWNGKVCVNGWKKVTATGIQELLQWYEGKIKYLMCTDIAKDGMMGGTAVELYRSLKEQYPQLYLIASGGVGCRADLEALDSEGIDAVVVGKAFYEGKISLQELCSYY